MTLVGFLRGERMNVYMGERRVTLPERTSTEFRATE